jgi:hypothetical protein
VNLVLAETDAKAQEKMSRMPTQMRAFFEQLVIPCTPVGGVAHVRLLIDAGFDYVIFQGADPETLELLASGVLPQFREAATPA